MKVITQQWKVLLPVSLVREWQPFRWVAECPALNVDNVVQHFPAVLFPTLIRPYRLNIFPMLTVGLMVEFEFDNFQRKGTRDSLYVFFISKTIFMLFSLLLLEGFFTFTCLLYGFWKKTFSKNCFEFE